MTGLREFKWIWNSRLDLIDFWLNLILIIIGLFIISPHQSDRQIFEVFQNFDHFFGINFIFAGSVNLFRLLYDKKLNDFVILFFQAMTFFCFTFLAFNSFVKEFISIPSIIFVMFSSSSFLTMVKSR